MRRKATLNHRIKQQLFSEASSYFKALRRANLSTNYAFFFKISYSSIFNWGIQFAIICNTIALSLDRYGISETETQLLEKFNLIFSIVFFIEMIIKFLGMGFAVYAQDNYNLFDAIIVVISIIEFVLSEFTKNSAAALSAIRVFRILRVFKLAKNWMSFRHLLSTIFKTLSDMKAITLFLFSFIYFYAIFGMKLFGYKVFIGEDGIPTSNKELGNKPNSNFNNIQEAFLSVFIVLVNDGWSTIFFQHAKATNSYYLPLFFFVSLLLIGQLILLNLFLAILLNNFESDS